ncbi:MAG TPA: hypothetical protein VNX28_07680 [Gemmataceae bacterium]|jgi:hypothetical protein|nr:hypothetical protein [Gemmataceae bacterium]
MKIAIVLLARVLLQSSGARQRFERFTMSFYYYSSLCRKFLRPVCQLCGLFLVFAATYSTAQATLPPVGGAPEIDPSAASSALAMLTCGFFILTGSRRRK